jgi:hypothetical protein
MENSLSPAFVKIESSSPFAPHVMTIPSVPLIAAIGEAPPYFDLRGAEIDVNVDTAINDFVNKLKPLFFSTYKWSSYTVFSQPGVGDTPVPVWSAALSQIGTSAEAGSVPAKAWQQTFTFRATDFTLFKLVLLDSPIAFGTDRQVNISGNVNYEALRAYVVAPETWIASRGGGRPQTFLQLASTLNEKLRRSYRMT